MPSCGLLDAQRSKRCDDGLDLPVLVAFQVHELPDHVRPVRLTNSKAIEALARPEQHGLADAPGAAAVPGLHHVGPAVQAQAQELKQDQQQASARSSEPHSEKERASERAYPMIMTESTNEFTSRV